MLNHLHEDMKAGVVFYERFSDDVVIKNRAKQHSDSHTLCSTAYECIIKCDKYVLSQFKNTRLAFSLRKFKFEKRLKFRQGNTLCR